MPKRKRGDLEETPSANPAEQKQTLRAARLEQKIEHGTVLLHRALKTARGFERQKLGRRQKTARSKKQDAQLVRLAEEVAALKVLDLHAAAGRYLVKQLVKTKRIAESHVFTQLDPSKRTLPQEGPKDGPAANVTARLFNSNPVREVLPGVMDGIREVAGVSEGGAAAKQLPSKKSQRETSVVSDGSSVSISNAQAERSHEQESDEDISMGDDELKQFEDRLASSDSESEDESPRPGEATYDHARDLSLSPTPSASGSESPPATAQKTSKSSKQTSATTFLPSLTVGGYWSGSESEPEADDATENIRKNRMGQQARRKLWEKKFGTQANHVRKQGQENKRQGASRDSGWDPRRGAIGGERGRGKGGKERDSNSRSRTKHSKSAKNERPGKSTAQGANSEPLGQKPQGDKPLHPSWEAARKAKEQKTQQSFQGKKIVFD